jgi:hypothetical protein
MLGAEVATLGELVSRAAGGHLGLKLGAWEDRKAYHKSEWERPHADGREPKDLRRAGHGLLNARLRRQPAVAAVDIDVVGDDRRQIGAVNRC